MKKIYIIGSMALLFAACKPSVNITTPATPGTANFTNYMAIGNELSAGFTDGSLTLPGQLNSYPERLFEQFGQVGCKGPFIQPLLNSTEGYPTAKYILGETYNPCTGDSSMAPILYPGYVLNTQDEVYSATTNNGQINNISVPGIRVVDYAFAPYAEVNPYAARFYNNPAGTPMSELSYMVRNLHPTFITLWLGQNDILSFATAGGVGNGTGNSVPTGNLYPATDISPTAVFEHLYDSILNIALSGGGGGVNGALMNIPDVRSLPFFTTVPANGLVLTRQTQADSLTALYGNSSNYSFVVGNNYFVVQDATGHTRQAIPGELILLSVPQDSLTCANWGSSKPIPTQYVLTTDDLTDIDVATSAFNTFIQSEAVSYHLAFIDMNSYFKTLTTGITFNGVNYNAQFVTGGAFSLDGLTLTQRGYAIIANQIISGINNFYGSTMTQIDVNKYVGVEFPKTN